MKKGDVSRYRNDKTLHLEGSFILCIKRLGYSEAMAHPRSCTDKRGPASRHPHLLSAGTIWMVEEIGAFHSEIQNTEALRAAGKYMSKHKATVSSRRFPCILNTFYLLLDRSELTFTALNLPQANVISCPHLPVTTCIPPPLFTAPRLGNDPGPEHAVSWEDPFQHLLFLG